MFHQSMSAADAAATLSSPAYPVLASIHAKTKLVIIDRWQMTDSHTYYTMGLSNGLTILHISYDFDEIVASLMDTPFSQINNYHMRRVIGTKNPRYLISTLTGPNKEAGKKLRRDSKSVLDSGVRDVLHSLSYSIKRNSSPDLALSQLDDDDIHTALTVLVGDKSKLEIPAVTLNKLQMRYDTYNERLNAKNGFYANVDSVFNREKWIVCSRGGLNAVKGSQYYVGAVNTAPLVQGARQGSFGNAPIVETVKVQLYNDLTELPGEFRDDVIASLTMFKQYRKANHPGLVAHDKAGYVPITNYLLDVDSGAVAWGMGGSAYFLMVDK